MRFTNLVTQIKSWWVQRGQVRLPEELSESTRADGSYLSVVSLGSASDAAISTMAEDACSGISLAPGFDEYI